MAIILALCKEHIDHIDPTFTPIVTLRLRTTKKILLACDSDTEASDHNLLSLWGSLTKIAGNHVGFWTNAEI